jgi:hypothetical protein
MFKALTDAIFALCEELKELREQRYDEYQWLRSHEGLVTKTDLKEMETRIMSAISDFAVKQNAFNDRIDASITGVRADVTGLNDLILRLQNSPGPISPEDQASLDSLQVRGEAITAKLEALDALTPPVVPAA